jgi:uncharacterized membrane protein
VSRAAKELRQFNQRQSVQIQASRTQFIGPLPPPEILLKYNDALPNAAERIVSMAESQQKHRQELEKQVIDSNCRAQQRGPIFGFIVCMSAIGGGVYLIHTGKDASGLASIITALASLAVVFIYGKTTQRQQLREQATGLVAPPQKPT